VLAAHSRTVLLAGALAAATAALAPWLPWATALDNVAYDTWHRVAGTRAPVRHVAIAAIDDASLLRFRDTPLAFWQPQLGQALTTLRAAGVRAVGIDLIQAASAESWLETLGAADTPAGRAYEAPFRAALAGGDVVLAAARGSEGDLLPPLEHQLLLPRGLEDAALVNLDADDDGAIRRMRLHFGGEAPAVSFAARLALAAQGHPATAESLRALDSQPEGARPIAFAGPPGSVPRVSLVALTAADAMQRPEVQALRGKVVVVAPEATSLQDVQLTPYSRALPGAPPQLMSGGELHAQALEALLAERRIGIIAPTLTVVLAAALGLLLAIAVARLSPLRSGLVALAAAGIILLASFALFLADLWLTVSPLLLGGGLAWAGATATRSGREARERSRLRSLFARYVSDEVADLAVRGALPDTGGTELELTILFTDIRNFTAMSEKLSSREVFEMLNAWLARACAPVLAHGGNVDKFIGDAVMAVFGAPVQQPDHARQAIAAAREMASAAEGFRSWLTERFPGRELPPFAIGIGIHSGRAVVGNLGTERRVEFTAIGDAVNLASRLESATKELGWRIVASSDTLVAAGPQTPAGARATISVKGKAAPIEVVEIL
jgi:adenylate cyclase